MMLHDPLSRASREWLRFGIVAAVAGAITAAIIWSLAPVRSERAEDWPRIVYSSLIYAYQWATFLISGRGDWHSIKQMDVLPFLHGALSAIGLTVTAIFTGLTIAKGYEPKGYGESKYASPGDLKDMGLRGKLGPVLGRVGRQLLMPEHPRHSVILAPTRGGKTAGSIIPTLLTYPDSMVVIDPKGELTKETAGAQMAAGRDVFVINWTDENSPHGWNPLGEDLPQNESQLEMAVSRIMAMIYPKPEKGGGNQSHWIDGARRNGLALALFEVYEARRQGRVPTIENVASAVMKFNISDGDPDTDSFGKMLQGMAKEAMHRQYPSIVSDFLMMFGKTHPEERSSHLSTLITGMQLFRLKAVASVTSRSDFGFLQLRKKPTTIYIKFPESDTAAFGKLTGMFFEALFAWNLDYDPEKGDKNLLIIGEEFSSLPPLPLLGQVLAKGAGRGLHLQIVLQDLSQYKEKYSEEGVEQLFSNATYLMILNQANPYTAAKLTKVVGQYTRRRKSSSGKWGEMSRNISVSEEGVPLIREEQWGAIPFGQHIVLVQNYFTRPVYAKASFWFKNRHLKRLKRRGDKLRHA